MRSGVIWRIAHVIGAVPIGVTTPWQPTHCPWNVAHPLSVPGLGAGPRGGACPPAATGACTAGACGAWAPTATTNTNRATVHDSASTNRSANLVTGNPHKAPRHDDDDGYVAYP